MARYAQKKPNKNPTNLIAHLKEINYWFHTLYFDHRIIYTSLLFTASDTFGIIKLLLMCWIFTTFLILQYFLCYYYYYCSLNLTLKLLLKPEQNMHRNKTFGYS
jgi:hypothetical protein